MRKLLIGATLALTSLAGCARGMVGFMDAARDTRSDAGVAADTGTVPDDTGTVPDDTGTVPDDTTTPSVDAVAEAGAGDALTDGRMQGDVRRPDVPGVDATAEAGGETGPGADAGPDGTTSADADPGMDGAVADAASDAPPTGDDAPVGMDTAADGVVTVDVLPDVAIVDVREAGGVCLDRDGDRYGMGTGCLGVDCNDNDPRVNAGATERCNNGDDDCDGMIDEDIAPVTCGTGACMRTVTCVNGAMPTCVARTEMPEVCNGQDDDCDGTTDEGLADLTCGVGACAQTAPACVAGVPGTCTPGMPGTETCPNGIDEDCNGMVDDCPVMPPPNDSRTNATSVTLGSGEVTAMGTTEGATRDGPTTVCNCTASGNVWYTFDVPATGIVYIDTAGSGSDTGIFVTNSAGALVASQVNLGQPSPGLCNDNAGCGTAGGFTSDGESRTWGRFNAGTYYVSVSTCMGNTFTLHLQYVAGSVATDFNTNLLLAGDATQAGTVQGSNVASGTCGGAMLGEDAYWFVTCGATQFFSLCSRDGGDFHETEGDFTGFQNHDPVMYVTSAQTGAEIACNDDGGGTGCEGYLFGDTASRGFTAFGSRLPTVSVPRGLGVVFIDQVNGSNAGMEYSLKYTIADM